MNRDLIQSCIADVGCQARLTEAGSKLIVEFVVQGRTVTLAHSFPDELLRLPKFYLLNGHGFGKLAHVLTNESGESGEVCIADPSSTAVNTDQPELAYRDTVEEHVRQLTRLIEDPAYNRAEQLREFDAHWKLLCDNAPGGPNELFVACDGDKSESLQVKPPRADSGSDLQTTPIALAGTFANGHRLASVRASAGWGTRQVVGKALAVRLDDLEPAPGTQCDLLDWYFKVLARVDRTSRRELRRLQKQHRREYWFVFSTPIPDGETMFALRWHTRSSTGLPTSAGEAEAGRWTVTPYRVRSLSRGSLVPRGGGSLDLRSKSVLLVGCGSVGSDVALRLTSAGIGHLTVSDPEKFSEENLYRHTLSVKDIGRFKTEALAEEIDGKHPWADVTPSRKSLEDLCDSAVLQTFDLVIIAIGSPNVERVFAEFCRQEAIDVPVINCWLEGYGIGGHAIIAVPGTKGCWHCAYVDPKTLTRGLASNLNFLEPDQVVMRNHGGCGTQFLPYNGIAAGYTAAIAADLAVRFLEGQVTNSSKVSGKERTWRFSGLPLRFPGDTGISPNRFASCLCMTGTAISVVRDGVSCFEGYGRRVTVYEEVVGVWHGHRQTEATAAESFGVLMGTTSVDRREIWIEAVTTPMPRDQRSRFSFALRDPGHQRAVSRTFAATDGRAIYLGTWHTHPEPVTEPTGIDRNDWVTCLRANRGRPLAFVVVGTQEVRVFVRKRGSFRPLRQENKRDGID